jgi:hypothetical protein
VDTALVRTDEVADPPHEQDRDRSATARRASREDGLGLIELVLAIDIEVLGVMTGDVVLGGMVWVVHR